MIRNIKKKKKLLGETEEAEEKQDLTSVNCKNSGQRLQQESFQKKQSSQIILMMARHSSTFILIQMSLKMILSNGCDEVCRWMFQFSFPANNLSLFDISTNTSVFSSNPFSFNLFSYKIKVESTFHCTNSHRPAESENKRVSQWLKAIRKHGIDNLTKKSRVKPKYYSQEPYFI